METETDDRGFVRGLLPGLSLIDGSRLPKWMRSHLPMDTVEAAKVPAAVHLALAGDATRVVLRLDRVAPAAMCSPTLSAEAVAWQDETIIGRSLISSDPTDLSVEVEVNLGKRDTDRAVRLALPENFQLRRAEVRALTGSIKPAPRRQKLVVYGDSITQNWSVSTPGGGWASRVAERLDLELVNLGFAGSARGEVLAALAVAQSGAGAVVLAWGTNAWSRVPTDEHTIAATLRLFLRAVTEQMPNCPVLVLSPLLRLEAEDTPNAFGTTQRQLRAAIEEEVVRFSLERGLTHLLVLRGADLVAADQLVDGTHPGDEGNLAVAAKVTAALRALSN